MATPTATSRPTPEHIFNTLSAYQQSAALKAGIELDLFTVSADGAKTCGLVDAKTGAAERGVRILCDYLTLHGFLTKEAERYALTQESGVFLNRHSPACLASMADFLGNPWHKKNFDALAEAVRKGGTAGAVGDNTKPNDELWINFARSMAPLTIPAAEFIAELTGTAEGKPCETLMRRVHAALKPAGKAVTLEFVPNEDRVTPPMSAAFSLVMLAGTDTGDAYTFKQYEKMFGNVGFVKTTQHSIPDSPQQLLLSEK